MNVTALFIGRPVATALLTLAVALAGTLAYFLLPVAPMPQVDLPTINVQAMMSGASPATMASTVAAPLERHLGQIADVTEMSSSSGIGSSRVVLQFGLDRDINGAARDVQSAINASFADLPSTLKSYPVYRKSNPAGAAILALVMTSKTRNAGEIFDSAASVIAQKVSQLDGVGDAVLDGSSLPGVRVELNPGAMASYGIGTEDVRAALSAANANAPKGAIEIGDRHFQIYANDQSGRADEFRPLVVAYRNGSAVRLDDIAEVDDSVEDLRHIAKTDDKEAVLVNVFRQPGANIVATVQKVMDILPELRASIPPDIDMMVEQNRVPAIREALADVERTLVVSLVLVVVVVFFFLGEARATLIPAVAVSVAIVGAFGAMYLLGYSLNILTLMALTIATGFVVDDAIVVLENVVHYTELGMGRRQAALRGAREVSFTVLSMSVSLIAVFLPILMMGGIVGRLLREFSVTLAAAIVVSLLISLSTTPMMCATLLPRGRRPSATAGRASRAIGALRDLYGRSLVVALAHPAAMLLILAATIGLNVYLYIIVPKGFIPQQDTGLLAGNIVADQSASYQLMVTKLDEYLAILRDDPAVENVLGFTGGNFGRATNGARVTVSLKPLFERGASANQVIDRLRPRLAKVAGASLYLQVTQDVQIGGQQTNAQYQYVLTSDILDDLRTWTVRLTEALQANPLLTEVNSNLQDGGLESDLVIDRSTAARLALNTQEIDNALYDAFGQRQVSTIFTPRNQYHVVMEVAPRYLQSPDTLKGVFISTSGGSISGTHASNFVAGTYRAPAINGEALSAAQVASDTARNAATNGLANVGHGSTSTGAAVSTASEAMVPLAAVGHLVSGTTPLVVNHMGHFAATLISFNLAAGKSLSDATAAIASTEQQIGMPINVHGSFAGTAQAFQKSLANQPLLILAACGAVYIVLGILYESTIHPLTILSTLPSAGVGALIALIACKAEFSIIAMIGVILLIGIVKKNAIMMIDFALVAERERGLSSRDAIFESCLRRFRPILMTTLVALLGALPLALGSGEGSEIRRPLGIAVVGGLLVSQILTLYTTPVVYLCLDRLRPNRLHLQRPAHGEAEPARSVSASTPR